ncbi:MAG: serine/threonine protein kinase [Woeseia sp.]|mgnify:CR=1 FL=1|nr:serine/threonine protein kinase [Woeseia sp.]
MALLSGFRADQLISSLNNQRDIDSAAAQKMVERLKNLGPKVIPRIIDAIAMSDKKHTVVYVDILASYVNDKTLNFFREGLSDGGERVVSGTVWALSSATNYNVNSLLDFFDDDEVSKPALMKVLKVHQNELSVHELLRHAYKVHAQEKAGLFNIMQEIITEDMVPDLINRMGGKDPSIKVHLMQVLAKFKRQDIHQVLEDQLTDPNRVIRAAALDSLSKRTGKFNIEKISGLLQDPDLEVQNKAVDLIVNIKHPDTIKYLIPALKDESEYARRSAVEVLNEICNPDSVKDLLNAIKDDDWWVRSRAGDALAEIGGPKVVSSVLELVKDTDEEIRRTAIEILNQTKDEHAVDTLMKATDDGDWWVRERAVDALAHIGDRKALPKLLGMLGQDPKTDTVVIRALGKLGDANVITRLVPMLERKERDIRVETIKAISLLTDKKHAETIRRLMKQLKQSNDKIIINNADKAIKEIDAKFSAEVLEQNVRAEKMQAHTNTLLIEDEELDKFINAQQVTGDGTSNTTQKIPIRQPVLDIAGLQTGSIVDGRYKFVEKIGKGAFGTVLLMQDMVVDEKLVLKFLNPNVSSDEETMKRFVHELRYSRMITHKNVIRIYDFLHLQGAYAISMEYFPSHTLSAEIPDKNPMNFEKAMRFSTDMAAGMSVAHQAGVIHRDLKPANILVNDDGLLKIVDFGVAAAASSGDTQLTKTGYVIGSPKYMAPEQILGKKVDEAADIYSIGIMMYEMVTGIPPYTRGDHMSVMYQHVQGKAKACQEVNPKIPDDYAGVITKAMEVNKSMRYESMDELIDALSEIQL